MYIHTCAVCFCIYIHVQVCIYIYIHGHVISQARAVFMNLGDIAVYDTVRVWAEGFMEVGLGPAIAASATCGIATGVCMHVC